MYHWIKDKDYLKPVKVECNKVIDLLVQSIEQEGGMKVKKHLVGSGAKNMIAQNASEPIDLVYNLEIIDFGKFDENDCKDSTSALTTERKAFKEGNKTPFSIDVCIVKVTGDGAWHRLIHEKNGTIARDCYFWNEAQMSRGLNERLSWLKEKGMWIEVREKYVEKKNAYLTRQDRNHPSFIVYIEAVNEVYAKYNRS